MEPEQSKQGAEEEDLGHERLDDTTLKADYQRDYQHEDDDYVDDHRSGAILEDGPTGTFLRRSSG
jgi:hypothetical protein